MEYIHLIIHVDRHGKLVRGDTFAFGVRKIQAICGDGIRILIESPFHPKTSSTGSPRDAAASTKSVAKCISSLVISICCCIDVGI